MPVKHTYWQPIA